MLMKYIQQKEKEKENYGNNNKILLGSCFHFINGVFQFSNQSETLPSKCNIIYWKKAVKIESNIINKVRQLLIG